jgi:hypothetical protein
MKNRELAKAGILSEIVSLGVKLESREQKTRIKATGHKTVVAIDRWFNRRPEMKIRMLEQNCEMICDSKLLFGVEI